MQFTINHQPVDIEFQTVSICPNDEEKDNVYLFRCDRCGSGLTQIQGNVARMYPGEPTDDIPIIYKCYKCKKRHIFKTTNLRTPYIKVSLYHDITKGDFTTFHCIIDRVQLFRYNGFYVKKLPTLSQLSIPFKMHCFEPTCKQKYLIEDMI